MKSMEKAYELHRQRGFIHDLDAMRQTAVEQAPGRHVLVVGVDPLPAELIRSAAKGGKKLHFLHRHQINESLVRENEVFHVYFRKVEE